MSIMYLNYFNLFEKLFLHIQHLLTFNSYIGVLISEIHKLFSTFLEVLEGDRGMLYILAKTIFI
jgi:hypothetical protein